MAPARIVAVDPVNPDRSDLEQAVTLLRAGRLVAFPTETVYGLGANALAADAVARIFAAKGRPGYNPLIVHVADAGAARALAAAWPEPAELAARSFWPGPLTLVLAKRAAVPDIVTAGLATVALRVPAHPVAQALLRAAALPIAAPSANRFTRVSPTTAAHVARGLGEHIDLIIDGGPTQLGIESTVLDVTGAVPRVLRPGSIGVGALRTVLGDVAADATDTAAAAPVDDDAAPRVAPGMLARHYSPRAELRLFAAPAAALAAARAARAAGRRCGGVVLHTPSPALAEALDAVIPMPNDAADYARRLYAALHTLDDAGCDIILAEAVPDGPAWAGVRDRLGRAS